ncbi:unnamed protein product [Chrysoparadoxa australica]
MWHGLTDSHRSELLRVTEEKRRAKREMAASFKSSLSLNAVVKDLQKKVAALTMELMGKDLQIDQLQERLQKKAADLAELRERGERERDWKEQAISSKVHVSELISKFQALTVARRPLTRELKHLRQRSSQLESEVEELKSKLSMQGEKELAAALQGDEGGLQKGDKEVDENEPPPSASAAEPTEQADLKAERKEGKSEDKSEVAELKEPLKEPERRMVEGLGMTGSAKRLLKGRSGVFGKRAMHGRKA